MPVLVTTLPIKGKPEAPVTMDQIKKMHDNYVSGLIHTPFPNDATSAWISLNEVLALMSDNKGATGIRIYYGRYLPGTVINGKDYSNLHGVILVATKHTDIKEDPTIDNSNDMLTPNVNYVSYSVYGGQGDDNIPTKPPYTAAGAVIG